MANHFDGPPTLNGDERQQIEQIHRYLQGISDMLNETLISLSLSNFAPEEQVKLGGGVQTALIARDVADTRSQMRAMMAKLSADLNATMTALSDSIDEELEDIRIVISGSDREIMDAIRGNTAGVNTNAQAIAQMQAQMNMGLFGWETLSDGSLALVRRALVTGDEGGTETETSQET